MIFVVVVVNFRRLIENIYKGRKMSNKPLVFINSFE